MSSTVAPLPPCPWCNTARHVQPAGGLRTFYCRRCQREFDDSDDGEVGYGRPEKYAMRKESQQERKQRERNQRVSEGLKLAWARRKADKK